ncbi:replication factor RFC1 C terminal domain-domain-containing protein [Coniella lustricola]|uniref:Replication factor C subunit 1 n=1 Tax=Coniella lustricola TaxID=2025994 RepID=A0A2T3ABP5_9PEZI|nr:replication factor RFC1 C terminal domain-domain-containing protein [Coniella lustricola]
MPDIRNFFTPKGGLAPAKPPASQKEEPANKKGRGRPRKVIEDSDEDDESAKPPNKTVSKPVPKKKSTASELPEGKDISAGEYFASSQKGNTKGQTTPKKIPPQVPTRQSPRKKAAPSVTHRNATSRTARASYTKPSPEDEDAYMDDGNGDDGDDILVAAVKGGSKRENDDYVESSSDEEVLPTAKQVASRAKSSRAHNSDDEQDHVQHATSKAKAGGRKRKSPESDGDQSEPAPRKKLTTAKARSSTKKDPVPEDANFQALLDSVPTVRAPTPPPQDPAAKFDWRKAGGKSEPAPMEGTADIPAGADGCLTGMTFVFTGQLKSLGREDGQALVKRYGGKVTGAPSSKTTFVVLGDDAGPSKLKKIKDMGTRTIDENGLFELIRKAPANGGSGKNAEKAKEKQEAEKKKVQEAARELEREEQARRAENEMARKLAAARGAVTSSSITTSAQLWTTKYAPTQLAHICGNKANVEKIRNWLQAWPKSRKYDFQRRGADGMGGVRAVILSGPPGIGKTTSAHLAAKLAGYDVVESNASDTRSKKLVENGVSDLLDNTSLYGYFAGDGKNTEDAKKNLVLIMDEVDGMSAGDRGGVGALAKLCKKTEVPLILICNERRLPKMAPFNHAAYDIQFRRPTVDQVRSRIMTICHREGLKLPVQVVDALIEGSNKDIRQIINMLATIKLDQKAIDFDETKSMSKAWEKHVILKPWDICQKLLGGGMFSPASKATLNDKIELYFNDHEFSYLMIQENYLRVKAAGLTTAGYSKREENLKALTLMDQAAESISDGDLVDKMIHGPQQHWSLMPTHAVFSTVRPASFIAGTLIGSTFTSWLGNNSKQGKLGRLTREIYSHMRLKSSGDANEIRQQYLPVLWSRLVNRLSCEGKDAIGDVIDLMDSYYLTKDDFDALKELGVGPQAEGVANIETQTSAAFTRTYNTMSHPIPFMKSSSVTAPKKVNKEMPDLEDALDAGDDEADVVEPVDEEDEEANIKKDKYIKQPKAKPKVKAKRGAKKTADDENDLAVDVAAVSKGRAKGKVAARGKANK